MTEGNMKITVEKPSSGQLDKLNVRDWPIWEHGKDKFPWHYDMQEICYILQGKVRVKTAEETVEFGEGDLVTFPAGLSCEWEILEPVRKHYKLG